MIYGVGKEDFSFRKASNKIVKNYLNLLPFRVDSIIFIFILNTIASKELGDLSLLLMLFPSNYST